MASRQSFRSLISAVEAAAAVLSAPEAAPGRHAGAARAVGDALTALAKREWAGGRLRRAISAVILGAKAAECAEPALDSRALRPCRAAVLVGLHRLTNAFIAAEGLVQSSEGYRVLLPDTPLATRLGKDLEKQLDLPGGQGTAFYGSLQAQFGRLSPDSTGAGVPGFTAVRIT